jgi:hypothetical protein
VRGKKRVAVVFVVDGSGSGGGKEKDVGGVVEFVSYRLFPSETLLIRIQDPYMY